MNEGIIIVDKPRGITSFGVIHRIRRLFGVKKVGHAGTLDPAAEGVLVIMIGKSATKRCVEFIDNDKEYLAWMQFGMKTDSGDLRGKVIENAEYSFITPSMLEEALRDFHGDILQVPPMYSAIKKNGKRLYHYARNNQTIERPAKTIHIISLENKYLSMPFFLFNVICSKGTYIRTLSEDIAEKLGTVGCLTSLLRTRSGKFPLEKAVALDDLENYTLSELFEKFRKFN